MGIFSSDEEPCWSDVYNLQAHNRKYEAKIARLKSCLQEVKGIVTALSMNNWLQMNETARKSIQLLQKLITKAESEG